jgi:hypothetical protein
MKNWNIEQPKTLDEVIPKLSEYLVYCQEKPKKRNNETIEAVTDCIRIVEGNFADIRKRDKNYETEDRELVKILNKQGKSKNKSKKKK